MKNIHVLKSDKPSRLHLGGSGLVLCDFVFNNGTINSQHIYITSDEEIKPNEWYENNGVIFKADAVFDEGNNPNNSNPIVTDFNKKIILTTDQDLIKDGVQSIDDEFLEWVVKNPSCEEVKVNDWLDTNGNIAWGGDKRYQICNHLYDKIIISKEEPKQELHTCKYCGVETTQPDDECYAKPAQYPLEDFIRRESKSGNESVGILKGVIWQSERIPSIIEEYLETAFISKEQGYMNPQKWFEQFKKK